MAEQQTKTGWINLGSFSVKYSLTQTKILPTPFVNGVKMKLRFGIRFLMDMPVDLFALFYFAGFLIVGFGGEIA